MNDFGIREYQAADIPSLTDLWHRVFGDPVSLISAFFQQLPDMGGGVVAVRDGAVVGAAYMITGLTLKKPDGAELPCGYLYAVAVDPVFRGNGAGAALSRAAFAWGQ
ncbi:MAG: GNAT family N-acetyltransferase, partial [Oscillospiraceae bacterium]|nr:GNAT family N-acetyltransferase [Oscillospiraceae bacterium]